LLALLVLFAAITNQSTPAHVPAEERRILIELFTATGGERWMRSDGWGSTGSECDWYGVWCDFIENDSNRPVVMGLSLAVNNLEGVLPPSLAALRHLRTLSVSANRLSGMVPETILERWDRNEFEFDGSGNTFSNLIARATVRYTATGALCSVTEDLDYRVDFDQQRNRVTFQGVRCASTNIRSRETYCLVREGKPGDLARFSRGLTRLGFKTFRPSYDYPFTNTTHGVYLTTGVAWSDGLVQSVETYQRQGPIEVWSAQQLFLGLLADAEWEREFRRPQCDFQ
jgi:hypothetical protein